MNRIVIIGQYQYGVRYFDSFYLDEAIRMQREFHSLRIKSLVLSAVSGWVSNPTEDASCA
ncbi:hypothetical protein PP175_27820 (plasmid) [Aneurinibacillus sp. Ricciae_BoGa-3]|uniref:hypothetical protein n=1 Tax=Aneurinibacillus sp. Ricciae_BoGa-3 TaxID=3022697 RepID=UPI0023401E62|nr:hypothetical protein [Aneurinibacillus sp. Ricciae_BoGa-3]WCK57001.1 hypothetical protein PP175_27820 [Aneurinibacillus sp. Ricciae_BoGa-3]